MEFNVGEMHGREKVIFSEGKKVSTLREKVSGDRGPIQFEEVSYTFEKGRLSMENISIIDLANPIKYLKARKMLYGSLRRIDWSNKN